MAWRALMTAKSGQRLQPQRMQLQACLWGCISSDVKARQCLPEAWLRCLMSSSKSTCYKTTWQMCWRAAEGC